MKPQDIISDEHIDFHHCGNFGPATSNRRVVDEGVLKTAMGYHSGSTVRSILRAHGLADIAQGADDPLSETLCLTPRGQEYLRAIFYQRGVRGIAATLDFLEGKD